MKITIKEQTPTPPPKTIILELTEGEAGLLAYICRYYANELDATATVRAAAADRLYTLLKDFKGKATYPYENYFATVDSSK